MRVLIVLTLRRLAPLALPLAMAACAPPRTAAPSAPVTGSTAVHQLAIVDAQAPPFTNGTWMPFTRDAVVAIAMREWRMFGQPVDDDPPNTRPEPLPQDKPERQEGLWQRVGEYWWIGQDPGTREAAFTGKHTAGGEIFKAKNDADYAWSAAFISYVMRIAGAGRRFPYAPSHSYYINAAAEHATDGLSAYPIQAYAPQLGDIICTGRGAHPVAYAQLPTLAPFASHCDIVAGVRPGMLTVLGGNVDDAVTEKHVPTTPGGTLAGPDGVPVDTRYPWFAVLKVNYDEPVTPPAA